MADATESNNERREDKNIFLKLGVSYDELEKELLTQEITERKECFPDENVSKKICPKELCEVQKHVDSHSVSSCEKHTVRRFSFPNIQSGCVLAASNSESESIDIIGPSPKTLNIPYKCFETVSNSELLSGGAVLSGDLSKLVCLSNIYTENPITISDLPENLNLPPISSVEELKVKPKQNLYRSLSGGVVEDTESKVILPLLYSFSESKPSHPSLCTRSMSGGCISKYENDDHVIFSDILSQTLRCKESSKVKTCQKPLRCKELSEVKTCQKPLRCKESPEVEICQMPNKKPKLYFNPHDDFPGNTPRKKILAANDGKTEDDSKNASDITTKERNQNSITEITKMMEEILVYYNTEESESESVM